MYVCGSFYHFSPQSRRAKPTSNEESLIYQPNYNKQKDELNRVDLQEGEAPVFKKFASKLLPSTNQQNYKKKKEISPPCVFVIRVIKHEVSLS